MAIGGIQDSARALSFYARMHEVTANNVANGSTDGFKADRVTAFRLAGTEHPVPVQSTDLRQGTVRETGRPLDIAIRGPGFLVVETESGERLTRGGSLRLDAVGHLIDGDGALVLGEQGPIVITGGTVELRKDGTLVVDGVVADRLRLETVEDASTLLKEGMGRFAATTPTGPADASQVELTQGAIEESNFDVLGGMLDLITIQRAYAANADALKTMDAVLGTVVDRVGRV